MTKAVLYTYSTGNCLGSIHFIWRIPEDISEEDLLKRNADALHKIQPLLPTYHTRAMKKQFFNQIGLFRIGKPAVLRAVYKQLTGMFSKPIHIDNLISYHNLCTNDR